MTEKLFALSKKEMGYLWNSENAQFLFYISIIATILENSSSVSGFILNINGDKTKTKSWADYVGEFSTETKWKKEKKNTTSRLFVIKKYEDDFWKTLSF